MVVDRELVDDFGQLFIMAFDGLRPAPEAVEFFRHFRIGGIILFADNYDSPRQLQLLTDELQREAVGKAPLFVATDHEGGRVQRFRHGFTRIPPMAELGAMDAAATELMHGQIATELRAAGVNFNLAPVADLCGSDQPGAIGDRSFGIQPDVVAKHVVAAIRGLQLRGVLACVKHFPGHGATLQDCHDELPVIYLSRDELDQRDVLPFRAAFAAGVAAVMSAHVLYPNAGDPGWPASISRHWLARVLRSELAFRGLTVSDALEMKALSTQWTPVECGLHALTAGTDILLYYREADQYTAFYELRRALEHGQIDPTPIALSLRRVEAAKRRYLK